MKFNLKPNGRTLKHHFSYHWWQYALIIVLSFAVWNLIYTQTEYRAPGERRIDLYVQTAGVISEEGIEALQAMGERASSEVEEVNVMTILPAEAQDLYAGVQLVTYLSAREGDIYVLASEDFKRFAAQGAFMPLDGEEVPLDIQAEELKAGYIRAMELQEDGTEKPAAQSRLYGIPLAGYPGAARMLGLSRSDVFLSVPYYCDNPESTLAFINALLKEENL